MSGSHGKRRHHHEEEHEEHGNHEAWVIPYADVLTLLMALFLVLWALGNPDKEKTQVAAESFRRSIGGLGGIDIGFGGGPVSAGGDSILEGSGPALVDNKEGPESLPLVDPLVVESTDDAGKVPGDPLTKVEEAIREIAERSGLTTVLGARRESRGLVVTIVSDRVLFVPGQAEVQPEGIAILDVIADALRDIPNQIMVEGHTDSSPIATARFPSNWELSTSRATSVVRYLIDKRGIAPRRVSAVGYADTRPISEGNAPAARAKNRRVEIVVLSTA